MISVGGLGGIGKSALVNTVWTDVAKDYPHGAVVLDLHGHAENNSEWTTGGALASLLALLVGAERLPIDRDGQVNLLRTLLSDRRMFLVIDNVRHVDQVRDLLPGDSGSAVVVISRTRLTALTDAEHIDLKPLEPGAAQELFGRITRVNQEDERYVNEILEHCGGLPLVIQAVAASHHTGSWDLAELLDLLRKAQLAALDDDRWISALTVSLDLLKPDEREFLTLLSLHPSSRMDRNTVVALSGAAPNDANRLTTRLFNSYLVDRYPGGAVELHDVVRAHLVEQWKPQLDATVRDKAIARLLDHVAGTVARADALLEPDRCRPEVPESTIDFTDAAGALRWLRDSWSTVTALAELAADSGHPQRCVDLARLMRGFFGRDKMIEQWIALHRRALAAAQGAADDRATASTLTNLGMALLEGGRPEEAAECHARAAELFTALDDRLGATDARSSLAWVRIYQGESEAALAGLAEAAASYLANGRTRNLMISLRGMSLAAAALNRTAEALDHATRAVELSTTPRDEVLAVNGLAWVHFRAAHHAESERLYRWAAALAAREEEHAERARALNGLGNVAAAQGKHAEAQHWWSEADNGPVALNIRVVGELSYRRTAA
ncbi:transcriptional regulator, SARP family [Actinokineospora spheciospongiae]|uniref:Transcriptional regulator, SARP family n=1 Tax=Actinokineospora spheciospongiae TaxID=909613 RepID=W7J547_9PSEU|nr:transcriptional regulator, SARP family [Actinokineospora spheciospongiae]